MSKNNFRNFLLLFLFSKIAKYLTNDELPK